MNPEIILGVIENGLVLLNKLVPDQATVIANKIKSLRERWDNEISKGDKRDDALLDSIEYELRDIRELFSTAITSAALKIK
ncbi:MAG: hypothetical protein IPQ08_05815 [Chitinophagaceae bacterium]|nr:hypothetical protein [Chitinophagaceae bacterium]